MKYIDKHQEHKKFFYWMQELRTSKRTIQTPTKIAYFSVCTLDITRNSNKGSALSDANNSIMTKHTASIFQWLSTIRKHSLITEIRLISTVCFLINRIVQESRLYKKKRKEKKHGLNLYIFKTAAGLQSGKHIAVCF